MSECRAQRFPVLSHDGIQNIKIGGRNEIRQDHAIHPSGDGQDGNAHTEQDLETQSQEKNRDGIDDDAEQTDAIINRFLAIFGGISAAENSKDGGEYHGRNGKLNGCRQSFSQFIDDRTFPLCQGVAKIKGEHLPQEFKILDMQRAVQPEFLTHFLGAFCADLRSQLRADRITGQDAHDKEDHGYQDQDHRDGQQQAGDQEIAQ